MTDATAFEEPAMLGIGYRPGAGRRAGHPSSLRDTDPRQPVAGCSAMQVELRLPQMLPFYRPSRPPPQGEVAGQLDRRK